MDDRFEIRLVGTGGQGLILAGIILAEAAAIYDNKYAVQTQSYGPEARGGASRSEVIISSAPIDYPEVIQADLLLALSQEGCDKYCRDLKKDGILIVDTDQVTRVSTNRVCELPITSIAREITGRTIAANIVGLGLITALTGIVSPTAIERAIAARVPRGTVEMNLQALAAGMAAALKLDADWARPAALAAPAPRGTVEMNFRALAPKGTVEMNWRALAAGIEAALKRKADRARSAALAARAVWSARAWRRRKWAVEKCHAK
jgi:2-oxoglutarate ferredoxin oxidoreductase subunit gamma